MTQSSPLGRSAFRSGIEPAGRCSNSSSRCTYPYSSAVPIPTREHLSLKKDTRSISRLCRRFCKSLCGNRLDDFISLAPVLQPLSAMKQYSLTLPNLARSLSVAAGVALISLSAPAQAQEGFGIPPEFVPPAGMCRIWIDNVPAGQQPAPTDCITAVRNRPANGRVLFGPELSKKWMPKKRQVIGGSFPAGLE